MKKIIFFVLLNMLCAGSVFAVFCSSCGQSSPDGAVFCSACGRKLNDQQGRIEDEQRNDLVQLRVFLAPDQRNEALASNMFRLTTEPIVETGGNVATMSKRIMNGFKCYEVLFPRRMLGEQFTISFNADRRKYRMNTLEKWRNKRIECSGIFQEPINNVAAYAILAKLEQEVFALRIEFSILTAHELVNMAKQEQAAQREAARISKATDDYYERQAEIKKKSAEESEKRHQEYLREQQLRATEENNRLLQQLNFKLGY